MKRPFLLFGLLFFLSGCMSVPPVEDGVSFSLAQYRRETVSDLRYSLFFNIPEDKREPVTGTVSISFSNTSRRLPQIDFKAPDGAIESISVNGEEVPWNWEKEHIIFGGSSSFKGETVIEIHFTSPDQSLNRRDDLLYTLLVPDRARTLFPCFDQPNLKGRYTLALEVPQEWVAVSNMSVISESCRQGRRHISFKESEPLSTYLFSFVSGKFSKETESRNGRSIAMYHRETDLKKLSQIPSLFSEVFESIDYLEKYTAIPYPFEKYDFIVLPGFQYGGMEHTGATLYNDTRIFLNEGAQLKDEINRYQLIAHETAHMWFGDYVTMEWFDEVWTKEVFANYFAALMTSEKFPDVDLGMNFADYARAAYQEDRTKGTVPVKQPLDNLKNAGLVYGNIIYNKSPIVMEMLATKMGPERFKEGIREYLHNNAYGNASWSSLVDIFDARSEENLAQWSRVWIEEKGMPVIRGFIETDGGLSFVQEDPWERSLVWEQKISAERVKDVIIPNVDAKSYGYFFFDSPEKVAAILLDSALCWSDVQKSSTLINLNENYLHNNYDSAGYGSFLVEYLNKETNQLLFSQALGCLSIVNLYDGLDKFDDSLWKLVNSRISEPRRRSAFSALVSGVKDSSVTEELYRYFLKPESFKAFKLNESLLTNMAFELSIRMPDNSEEILSLQRGRITNGDRLARFDYISRAVVSDTVSLDSLFESLLIPQNRRIEPWAASALRYLNHPLRAERSRKYILPALEELERVQATGDIFFPKNWASALLAGHPEKEADDLIEEFFMSHPDYSQMLSSKILQCRR